MFIGILTNCIGVGYFIYGKKRERIVAMVVGVALCIVPFFVGGWLANAVVAGVLCAVPFFVLI